MGKLKLKITKRIVACAALLLAHVSLMAQANCDPANNGGFGCDEDLPLDAHIWVLVGLSILIGFYCVRKKMA